MTIREIPTSYTRSMYKMGESFACSCASVLRNKSRGFTLVEMSVAMTIIAILFTLLAFGMISAGKQTRLRDAAKTLQSNIRQMANNAITVSPDMADPSKPAKAWAIRIPGNIATSYYIEDYSDNSGTKESKEVNLEYGITVETGSSEDVHLIFSSPFAEYNSIRGQISSWVEDSDNYVVTPIGTSAGDITITLRNPDGGNMQISVDGGTGEASVN